MRLRVSAEDRDLLLTAVARLLLHLVGDLEHEASRLLDAGAVAEQLVRGAATLTVPASIAPALYAHVDEILFP